MPLLTATNLSKSFGPDDIFLNISLSIPNRARIALVGANGVGKTTLLRVLLGVEESSGGEVQVARGIRLGYLPQEAELASELTLWQECMAAFSDLLEMQRQLEELEARMADPEQARIALAEYGSRQQAFDRRGGYTYEQTITQTLIGLGFLPGDFQRPVSQLSGGQRTRAYLALLLLSSPDLLLLDEPTNHLDINAVEWLESFLKDWDGAVLIVSHDRYFLDQVAEAIWEMSPALEVYRGNYSAYLSQRAERYQRRLEEYQSQMAFVEKEEEYIRRNLAGQNARQAQGRRKRLERMLEEARLTPLTEPRRLHLRLLPAARSGDLVVRTYRLRVGYHDEGRHLFRVPDLVLRRGECAAIIGPNGAGKTTFLKTILSQIPPFSGEVELGASLNVGYFAQAHEGLHPDLDLVAEIQTVAPEMRPAEVRAYLAKFLFTGEDVFKPVSVLSGGERGRMALARLALGGANLLLLDEPTNHLDLSSQDILQTILSDYPGTILLVSHDRYLVDALATQIWEVDPGERVLRVFKGTYSEYKAARQADAAAKAAATIAIRVAARAVGNPAAVQARGRPAGPSKEVLRKHQERIQAVETHITEVETQLSAISRQLENPPADESRVIWLGQEYQRLEKELEKAMHLWTELSEEL